MLEPIYALAIVIGIGTVGFLLRGFLASYVSEKGKNVATKEDIAQITRQIENVKASIQTLTQLKTDYEKQRRQWVLSFYDSSVEMLHEKFGVNFGDLPFDGGRSLFEFQKTFGTLVSSMVKEYQRIVLYFEHEDPVRINAEKVLNAALKGEMVFKRRFGRIKVTSLEEGSAFASGDRQRMEEAVAKSNEANKLYWDEMNFIGKSFRDALQIYLSYVNPFLKRVGQDK